MIAGNRSETNDLKDLINVCREYITAVRVKEEMNKYTGANTNVARSLELVAYFTHCNLQPGHLLLALKTAMASAFKNKNYINAASFARRLLELPDINLEKHGDTKNKAQKVLQKSEKEGRNEHAIDYDEKNPFNLDCFTMKPIYKGSVCVKCPYCQSHYAPEYKEKLCMTCRIAAVGIDTMGLVTQNASRK